MQYEILAGVALTCLPWRFTCIWTQRPITARVAFTCIYPGGDGQRSAWAKMFLRVKLKGYKGLLGVTIDELCQPHTTKADFRIGGRHNHIIKMEATCCSLSEWKENNWCQFKIFTHTTYGTREIQQKATGIFCFPNRDPRETWLYSVFKFNVDPMSINLVFNGWKWSLKGFPDENY